MKYTHWIVLVTAAAFSAAGRQADAAAPEPSPVPVSWQLEMTHRGPKPFPVRSPDGTIEVYWYFQYKVVNRTGEDRDFLPDILLYTDTGQVIRAGAGVPASVFNRIKSAINDPLLRDGMGMMGKLKQGEDNHKRGLAIFRDFDPQAGGIDLFISGLSGERVTMALPREVPGTKIEDGRIVPTPVRKVTLAKNYHARYLVGGNLQDRVNMKAHLLRTGWVMR